MAWYNTLWKKRKKITLTGGTSGAQTDYPVLVNITWDADMLTDFDDLRFTQADGDTLLDAWLDSFTASTSAKVWVKTDTPASTVEADIYMYYGNSNAASDWSGPNTFDFFDGFEDNDTTDWTKASGVTFDAVTSPVKHGTYAAKYTSTTAYAEAHKSVGSDLPDRMYEFYARSDTINIDKYLGIEKTGGAIANSVCVIFSTSSIVYYDGAFHWLQAYTVDTWYKFSILTHPADDTFDLWIDDVSKGTDLGTRGSIIGGINAISFSCAATTSSLFADKVLVRKYVANPATYAFGSEEGLPPGACVQLINGGHIS